MRQQHQCIRVFKHECQTIRRICRIERYIGTAGFQDSQQANNHFQRAFDTQAHQDFRAHSHRLKVPSQLIRSAIQFCIRQALVFKHDCHGIGGACHLFFEQLMHAFVTRIVARRLIPFDKNLMTFGL